MTRQQLRAWRTSLQWSQSAAAAFYGVSLRQWQRYETGATAVPSQLPKLIKLWEGNEDLRARLGANHKGKV